MFKVSVLLLSVFSVLTVALSPIDLLPMQALYNATNGASWTTVWNFSTDLCTNSAATVQCFANGRVRRLYLSNLGMTGSLPTEIGLLTQLDTLILNGNSIGGSLPTEIGLLNNTGTLVLNNNRFTGPIPTELGNIPIIQKMLLDFNLFSGTIPTQIAQHPVANEMRLDNNLLTGTIPTQWGPNVFRILLDNNNLTGTIPTEIFSFPTLNSLRFQHNQVTGTIPTQIGASNLFEFFCTANFISGTIPSQLGNLVSLQRFWIYGNTITGTIPTQVSNLVNLIDFNAWNNLLSGSVPSQFGLITTLQSLSLHTNSLTGAIPSELANSPGLLALSLSFNALTGHVPGPIIRSSSLTSLTLTNNCLGPLESYVNIATNDYTNYNTSSTCPLQGPYPSSALDQAPAVSYEFYSGTLLSDSSTSNVPLLANPSASYVSKSLGQFGNPFNAAIDISPLATGYAFQSQSAIALLGSYTVEILVVFPVLSNGTLFGLSSSPTGATTSLRVQINADGSISVYRSSTLLVMTAPAGTIQANRVHHILVTWDSSSNRVLYLYVDGALKNSVKFTSVTLSGTFYFLLANNVNVYIDEADVYRSLFGSSIVSNRISTLGWCPAGSCLTTCYPSYNGNACT